MLSKSERRDRKILQVLPPDAEILAALQDELRTRFGPDARGVSLASKRAQKGVYRLRVGVEGAQGSHELRVIAKIFRPGYRVESMATLHAYMNAAGLRSGAEAEVAVPRAFGVAGQALLMEYVEGDTLRSHFLRTRDTGLARVLARALVAVHRLPGHEAGRALSSDSAGRNQALLQRVRTTHPDAVARADEAVGVSRRLLRETRAATAMLHGDFHWGQVMIGEDDKAYVIDVSSGRDGDSAFDAGNVLAQLEKHRRSDWFQPFHDGFLEEYLSLMDRASLSRILAHKSLSLVRLAAKYAGSGDEEEGHLTADEMFDRACEVALDAKRISESESTAGR